MKTFGPRTSIAPTVAGGQRRVVGADDAHADAGQREADRAAAPLAVGGVVGVRGQHHRLAHAVALEDGVAGALPELLEGVEQERRRAADEEAHVRRRPRA